MPLLPAREDSHSPYPLRQLGDEGVLGVDWRIGEGPEGQGFASWLRGGKLGRWITNTHAGRMVYAIFLIVLYGVVSLILLIMNRFILWSR